ncbi:hypothetical protein PENNAL_c0001G10969 [Penicillium nalgiovense]|uniref:Amidase domain-containing protein n=1 Tax=Penicillium nalgiovense TaxID=60175 RepID=A0A1V6ZAU8_PENNA|nr:hypothetical protein PENNAL_c0001G10969 [Penicillium nalgiovense]
MVTHTVPPNYRQYLESLGNRGLQMENDRGNPSNLQPGPYLYIEKLSAPVYWLHDDTYRTFLTAVKPKLNSPSSTTYEQLKIGGKFSDCLSVAIPPRLASARDNRPLSRLRVGVKDCYFLEGLNASLCLRGLSSMFGREEPPKAVDFDIAFNPRENGYQSPAGSAMEVPHVVQYMIGLTALSTQIPVAVDDVRRWQWSLAISTFSRVDVSVYAYYHSFAAFRENSAEKYNGKPSYVLPSVQYRWGNGASVFGEQHKDAIQRMDTYKEWLINTTLAKSTSVVERLVILSIADAAPNYRDEQSQSPRWQVHANQLLLPPILGAPDIAIPIGDVPFVIGIMGAPTKDLKLQTIEKIMHLLGRPTTVTTASRILECLKYE